MQNPPLTPYDEFPIHQASTPFSRLPSTDYGWDDGYFFSAYCAEEKAILFTGMRVSANSDAIGGYAGMCIDGQQFTARFSRRWSRNYDTSIGPLAYRFEVPLSQIALKLDDNESDLAFDLNWTGLAPPFVEAHHVAHAGSRRTTDQTRYTQGGVVAGEIHFRGRSFVVTPDRWNGTRDHSWGLYTSRPPLQPDPRWLPPPPAPTARRALRFWMPFQTPDYSGFYHFHEDEEGRQTTLDDLFGTPFEGVVYRGPNREPVRFVSARHALTFFPGTRSVASGTIELVDEHGGAWRHEIATASPAWTPLTIGYTAGSWRDGGTLFTYHGEGPVIEWDEFDLSRQPYVHEDHLGHAMQPYGVEHIVHLTSTGPDGVLKGQGYLEFFCDGRYRPYDFA